MRLDRRGQEICHFPVTGAPANAAPLVISFDAGTTWQAMTWNADKTVASILVAGPSLTAPTGVVLPLGRTQPLLRLTDTPEVVVRTTGGSIDVS